MKKLFKNSTLESMNLRTARLTVEETNERGEVVFASECYGFQKGGLVYVKAPNTEDLFFRVYLEDTKEDTGSSILPMEVERTVKVPQSDGYPIDEEDSPLQSFDYDEDQFFYAILNFINREVQLELVNL